MRWLERISGIRPSRAGRLQHQHLKTVVLSLLALCLFSTPAQAVYCSASGSNYTYEHISRVQVGDIDNATAGSNYTDYTHLSTVMQIGAGYQITVTNAYPYDQYDGCGVWVDWNQDEDFEDAAETIAITPDQTTPGGGVITFAGTITPPAGAALGSTRMRIRVTWGTLPISPCGTTTWGEVEDYTIDVTGPVIGAQIHGAKFNDINGNGIRDGGEPPLQDWKIYIDENDSGQWDAAEQYDLTDANGDYTLTDLVPGSYIVAEVLQVEWQQTFPGGDGTHHVTVGEAEVVENIDFGNKPVPQDLRISGYVKTKAGVGIENVSVLASTGESDLTDATGYYELTLANPWTGNILPIRTDWFFDPIVREYSDATTDQTNQNFVASPESSYGGGSGTEGDPFRISTAEHMQAMGANPFHWDKHFRLLADIDLSPYTGEQFNMIGLHCWNGFDIAFTGVFDGDGHSISHFNYAYSGTKHEFIGIFSYVYGVNAEVKDVVVIDCNVNGGQYGAAVGALVGWLESGTIRNCRAEGGSVIGDEFNVGGLVGTSWGQGTITDCYCSVNVKNADGGAGGLVAANYGGSIINCTTAGDVTGAHDVGGLVGDNSGNISFCHSSTNVSGGSHVGGLVGQNSGSISQSYSEGSAEGTDECGGLAGRNVDGDISDCYSHASATGGDTVGGLVGLNWMSTISNCYSTGSVSAAFPVGGLVAREVEATTTASFWDTQTSDQSWSHGGTGKMTWQMQDANTFISAGWDFVGETANGTDNIWKLFMPDSYPQLTWQKYGAGTSDDPYLIYCAEDMQAIGDNPDDWNKHFKLMADIDLSGYTGAGFNIIGEAKPFMGDGPFSGVFDGNGHTIANFSYSSTARDYVGIFGYVWLAEIKNLGLLSPNISIGSNHSAGALVGYLSGGRITGCWVQGGSVSGGGNVGGLVGYNDRGDIGSSYSTASAGGTSSVGGLVGKSNYGYVFYCYSRGSASGNERIGGLMGYIAGGGIYQCYSTGDVSGNTSVGGLVGDTAAQWEVIKNSFWDLDSSGEPNSAAGTGLHTAQMQDANTFIDAGWDFVGETGNGGSDDWAEAPGGGYPVLWWQLSPWPGLPVFPGGAGIPDDPYIIANANDLKLIGHNPRLMDRHFRLTHDIDLGDVNFTGISDRFFHFKGSFDGDNHAIANFSYNSTLLEMDYVGIFRHVADPNAEVKNLRIISPDINVPISLAAASLVGNLIAGKVSDCHARDVNISGLYNVGGLVAGAGGSRLGEAVISNCSCTGTLLGDTSVGGLLASGSISSTISRSYSKASVQGTSEVGGLVGTSMYCTISDSYASGSVSGTADSIGGLAGHNNKGNISCCYSSGAVAGPDVTGGFVGYNSSGNYTGCFWDSTVNPALPGIGNGSEPNVVGASTPAMQTAGTFTSAAWDFVGETANGPEDIWRMCVDGQHYPKLWWEYTRADFLCPDGVTLSDYAFFADHWRGENCALTNDCDKTDLDFSGAIDWRDLKTLCDHWLEGTQY